MNEMEKLIKKYNKKLKLKGYSNKTIKAYKNHLYKFFNFLGAKKAITKKNVNNYILYLLEEEKLSNSYVNQALSSIKFFTKNILENELLLENIYRPKNENKLPDVLSQKEVARILSVVNNLKHKTILYVVYSAGLRVGEVVRLKIADIDSDRMLIRVKQGKGRKDRYTLLSEKCLVQLREYYKSCQPRAWLFPGGKKGKHLTERSVQKIFKKACKKAKIIKDVSVHSLRHSFATHLLEKGTDLRYIQKLLGHKSSTTTEIYTHVSKRDISKIKNPLDEILN